MSAADLCRQALQIFGPGVALAAWAWAAWRITRRLDDRRDRRRAIRRLEHHANQPSAHDRKEKP